VTPPRFTSTDPDAPAIPDQQTDTIDTSANIKDGDTVAIGGLRASQLTRAEAEFLCLVLCLWSAGCSVAKTISTPTSSLSSL
jgi:hypothetical protein